MAWYRCLIRGENFPRLETDEKGEALGVRMFGFYTTRWVVASSPKEAEMKALAPLRREKTFEPPPNVPKTSDARVFFEEVVKTRPSLTRGAGATWYPMEDEARDSVGR